MPNLEDIRLGQLSVAQGLCLPLEVEECLSLQERNEQQGNNDPLGELLVMKGFLTRSQLNRLLTLQREAQQKVSRIGPYDLIRKLGEGGMGAVYQAKDTRNDKMVALKVLPRSRARDKVFLQRFEQEARAAFELDHPNIIHGLDVGNADGYHFLVMEFVQGKDIYALLEQKGRLHESEALQILEQIAGALEHISGENLVHRDIKPENIIVTEDGVAKLADMGLALDTETQGRRRITQAGIAMGTPYYLSPEHIEGRGSIDIRSDIYALGATTYEMITGKPPFEGEPPPVVMMKHLKEQVPSPHDIDHGVSLNFCHVLEKMMAKKLEDRYQTPAELIADLRRVKEGEAPLSTRPAKGASTVARTAHTKSLSGEHAALAGVTDGAAGQGKDDPSSPRFRKGVSSSPANPVQAVSRSKLTTVSAPLQDNTKFGVFVAVSVVFVLIVLLILSALS